VDLLKEALNPTVMRVRLGGTRKSGGEFCKIDCFDFDWHLTRFGDLGSNPLISLRMKMDIDS